MRKSDRLTIDSRLRLLSNEKCRSIYDAALTIISEMGMVVLHDEARRMLIDAGATLVGDGRIRIPPDLVEQARATVPSMVPVFDRNGQLAMEVGGFNTYFGTGSDLLNIYDVDSGQRRLSALDDVARMAQLGDALPDIDFLMSSAYPGELDASSAFLECFRAMAYNSVKPIVATAAGAADLEAMWRVACELRGGARELRDKPYFIQYGESVSPLQHPVEVLDKLLFCADHSLPVVYISGPVGGGTAPITHAGHIALCVAESFLGMVIHQLRRPGAPLITGLGPGKLDMTTLQLLYNSPEYYTTYLGGIEMSKWLDLPNWGYAGTTDSQCVDAQAGMEIAELTLLSMQAGSNLNHDVGYLDFGLTGAAEAIVITAEFISLNRRMLEGIEVSDETLGLDALAQVGPGGNFLASKHTRRHLRSLQWRPTILNRNPQSTWEAQGAQDLTQKARRRASDLMRHHRPEPLPSEVRKRVDAIVDSFAATSRQG